MFGQESTNHAHHHREKPPRVNGDGSRVVMTQPRDYAALLPDEAAVTRWAAGLVLPGTPLFGSPGG